MAYLGYHDVSEVHFKQLIDNISIHVENPTRIRSPFSKAMVFVARQGSASLRFGLYRGRSFGRL